MVLAAELRAGRVTAAINSITVDSSGDTRKDKYRVGDGAGDWKNGGPKTYTLTAGEESIDLSSKNLGAADVNLLTTWLQRPEVSAALNKISVRMNDIGAEGGAVLASAACEMSRARLRACQVLAFSKALHERLGSDCALDVVADVTLGIATAVRSLHGHEALSRRLAQAGEPWFEVVIDGLDEEGVPPTRSYEGY